MEIMRKFWLPETCYYITMRGNNRQDIYHAHKDYEVFLQVVQRASKKYAFFLLSYCLVRNQYHLLLRSSQVPLSEVMLYINTTYSSYYKRTYKCNGQLFEPNFFTSVISTEADLFKVNNFLYEQPRYAGIQTSLDTYPYSSFRIQRFPEPII